MRRAAAAAAAAVALAGAAGCDALRADARLQAISAGALTPTRQDLAAFERALHECGTAPAEPLRSECASRAAERAALARAVSGCLPRADPHPGCRWWWSQVARPQMPVLLRLVDLGELAYQAPAFWSGAGPLVPWDWADRRAWLAPHLPSGSTAAAAAAVLAAGLGLVLAARAGLRRARQATRQASQHEYDAAAERERQQAQARAQQARIERAAAELAERERAAAAQRAAAAELAAAALAQREQAAAERERIEAASRAATAAGDLFGPAPAPTTPAAPPSSPIRRRPPRTGPAPSDRA